MSGSARKLAIVGLGVFFMGALPVLAQDAKPREAVISVSGEGDSAIAPDMAVLSFSVVKQNEAAATALAENSKELAAVLAALKEDGIAERDLQTSNFSIQPLYRQIEPKNGQYEPPVITGYQVTNGLTVRVRDLSKLGAILDRSIRLGINQGGGITFTNDKPENAITEARKAAVADAVTKAKTLAEAAGVRLGRVIEISENMLRPSPQPLMARAAMAKDMYESAPIAAGENQYTVNVNVTFAIEQ